MTDRHAEVAAALAAQLRMYYEDSEYAVALRAALRLWEGAPGITDALRRAAHTGWGTDGTIWKLADALQVLYAEPDHE